MLVVARKEGESLTVGDDIVIGNVWYQAQQARVVKGTESVRQLADVQKQMLRLQAQITQRQTQWNQVQTERHAVVTFERSLGSILKQAWTPEELRVQQQRARDARQWEQDQQLEQEPPHEDESER
jgi:sRNA-binding carbon storage regulator CsrA